MNSLFIHPQQAEYVPENDRSLVKNLQDIAFLGKPWPVSTGNGFLLGERFFQLITFMGCAPAFKLEPSGPGDEQFCHISISIFPTPQFRFLRSERPARCPTCRKPGITAAEFEQQKMTEAHWCCPSCQQVIVLQELDWRKEAGLARCLLEVRDVYPHEGVPTDHLLQQLREFTAQEWSYFYA